MYESFFKDITKESLISMFDVFILIFVITLIKGNKYDFINTDHILKRFNCKIRYFKSLSFTLVLT